MKSVYAVFGGPGTGKTTRLLNIVKNWADNGVPLERIAFFAFTRQAAYEAKDRTMQMLGITDDRKLPYFRTLHSMAYREMGLNSSEILQKQDWKEIGKLLRMPLGSGESDPDEGPGMALNNGEGKKARALLTIISYSRAVGVSLEQAWYKHGQGVDWHELKLIADTIQQYKMDTGKRDFADMLHLFVSEGFSLPVQAGVIDEAQDLTPIQWDVAKLALQSAEEVVIGGDDDQAIYHWAGADVRRFLDETGKGRVEVLNQSHRLPERVFDLSEKIIGRVRGPRQKKNWRPSDRKGDVKWVARKDSVDMREGEWLVLARNTWHLRSMAKQCRRQGVPYTLRGTPGVSQKHVRGIVTWERLRNGQDVYVDDARKVEELAPGVQLPDEAHGEERITLDQFKKAPEPMIWHVVLTGMSTEEREYCRAILRNGDRLQDKPRVRLDTIHSAKGAEARNVALLTDMTQRSYRGYELDPDSEHRTFYVGASRAIERLVVVAPKTQRRYRI